LVNADSAQHSTAGERRVLGERCGSTRARSSRLRDTTATSRGGPSGHVRDTPHGASCFRGIASTTFSTPEAPSRDRSTRGVGPVRRSGPGSGRHRRHRPRERSTLHDRLQRRDGERRPTLTVKKKSTCGRRRSPRRTCSRVVPRRLRRRFPAPGRGLPRPQRTSAASSTTRRGCHPAVSADSCRARFKRGAPTCPAMSDETVIVRNQGRSSSAARRL
jgi:hypothetical protein